MNTPVALSNVTVSPPRNATYRNQAKKLLKNSFPRISCAAIDSVLRSHNYNFTNTFTSLSQIDGDRAGLFPVIPNHIKIFIKTDRRKEEFVLNNEQLRGEVDAIPELNMKDGNRAVVFDLTKDGDTKADDLANNGELECLCCYGDYPRSEMRECAEGSGHLVCKQCIYHFVSEQLDGNRSTNFKCIAEPDCGCTYPMSLLDQTLTPKLATRVNDLVFREELEKAGLKSWTCPRCAYTGFTDGDYPWIACDQCNGNYCTLCNETYHDNRTCDDVRREKEREKDPRHRAHEAMSEACKRYCPHCNQQYMKSDGCNKIKCKCKLLSCYLCGDKIQDYSHFCNCGGKSKCKCGKTCMLWTSTKAMEEIDRQRRQAAGREVLSKAGYTDEKEILSILASPPAKKRVANEAAARLPAARAQQPNIVPMRPPQANPVLVTPPRHQGRAVAAVANNPPQIGQLLNRLNLPPTPNHRDPLMGQPLQARQEPDQPINEARALRPNNLPVVNNAAPQNPRIHIMILLFTFVISTIGFDRVKVLSVEIVWVIVRAISTCCVLMVVIVCIVVHHDCIMGQ